MCHQQPGNSRWGVGQGSGWRGGEERLHLASTLLLQQQPSSLTPPLVLSWRCSLNCRIGLCLPQDLHQDCRGGKPKLLFPKKKGSEFHAQLGRMFVFHGCCCPCFQSKRLCKCTPACGVHGEWTLSPLFLQAWTKPQLRTTLVV